MGPKQGVQPAAKAMPINIDVAQLPVFLGPCSLFSISKKGRWRTPNICSPNVNNNTPLILVNHILPFRKILPKALAVEPIKMNIKVKPSTKPTVRTIVFRRFIWASAMVVPDI
jgi:hypothetical protein